MTKRRLDILLTEKGLADSRSKAQALIMAGKVRVDGRPITKAGAQIPLEARLNVEDDLPYASRGGLKLAAALDEFALDPRGTVCTDVGASTGGFTDVLLQRGAARVYAIDVGYGQLAWSLRQDERVVVMERTNARYLETLPEQIDLATIDVSFISLKLIFPAVVKWLQPAGLVVALVKPQFEAGKTQVGKGGVVRDRAVQRQVLEKVLAYAAEAGLIPFGLLPSPITGPAGNQEFLIGWQCQIIHSPLETTVAIENCLAGLDTLK
ncbi:MAG: TlyA family RNA methyltransferase [Anaerolineae bacterium]|nr:TlyA family RNA methyltransferase [Anaerolineae bacterium]